MKRKIYLASSWHNPYQEDMVKTLRAEGHEVYDFKNPAEGNHGFGWDEMDAKWTSWGTLEFIDALKTPIAERGFNFDFSAMKWADTCVLLLPCGKSAHLEAGYFVGAGKRLYILLYESFIEPELMYKMATGIFHYVDDLLDALGGGLREINVGVVKNAGAESVDDEYGNTNCRMW